MEFTQQGSWKTQDGRMATKCWVRFGIHSLPWYFFLILPSWIFQPSSYVSSLIISHERKQVIKSEEARQKWPSSHFALVYYCAMAFRSCSLFSSFSLLSNYCVLLEGLQMFSRVVWSCSSYFFSSDPLLLFFGSLFYVRELFLFRKVSTSFVLRRIGRLFCA